MSGGAPLCLSLCLLYAKHQHTSQDMAMRISAILMSCSDSQKHYLGSLKAYVDALAQILNRDKDVKVILRDREILVSRVLKLTSKKTSERATESYNAKLDEAQRELGACEAVLKQEEVELALAKQRIFKEALEARFKAMIDVAALWTHTAEEALALLERVGIDGDLLDSPEMPMPNGHLNDTGSPALSDNGDAEEQQRRRVASDPGYQANADHASRAAGNRQPASLGRSTARPPTVTEVSEPADDSSSDDEAILRQMSRANAGGNKSGGTRFGSPNKKSSANHKRNNSEESNTANGSPRKGGGLFGSLASLFKPRDDIQMRSSSRTRDEDDVDDRDPRYSSPKKGGGWSTRTDANIQVTKALNEKSKQEAAAKRAAMAPRPQRRGSDASYTDNRPLVKVVNSNGPPLWQELGITANQPRKTTSRSRAGSVSSNRPAVPGQSYGSARRAMSDSGLDDLQTYEPPPITKRKAAAPQLSRNNSVSSNVSATHSILKKRPAPANETVWKPVPAGAGDRYTPSLLSVVSDNTANNTGIVSSRTANRKYLTGSNAPGGSLGSLGVVPTTNTKAKRSSSLNTAPVPKPAPSTNSPRMTLPVSNAFRAPKEDAMNTLVLPSAAGSRAAVSGNTLTLPTAPPPVSSMQMPSVQSVQGNTAPNGIVRSPSPIPFPAKFSSDSAPYDSAPRRVLNPAHPQVSSRPPSQYDSGSYIERSPSPTPTNATRRKSVRIADGTPGLPSPTLPAQSFMPEQQLLTVPKGKGRATEEQINGWTSNRHHQDDSDEDEDPDVSNYKQVSFGLIPL